MNDLQELKKALDLAGAGSILHQPEIDAVLAEIIERNNPLRQNLPRKPGSGSAYIFNRRTARGGAQFVNDTEEPSEQQSTVDQLSFPYRSILYRGKVTRRLQKQGKSLLDIEAEEIESGLQSVRDREEEALLVGDAAANPKQFSGLRKLVPAGQTVEAGANGGQLSLKLLDEAIDKVIGNPNMLLMTKAMHRKLNSLLQAQQRFMDTVEVKGGFRLQAYQSIPIYRTIWQPTSEVQGTANDTQSLYVLEAGPEVFVSVLTEITMERLAKTSSQGSSFDIYEDQSLVIKNELKAARLKGLQAPN
ncbi:MAG: phage major capsid protein [Elusimicrobiota bacterium]